MLTIEDVSKLVGPVLTWHNKLYAMRVTVDDILSMWPIVGICGIGQSEYLNSIRRYLYVRLKIIEIKQVYKSDEIDNPLSILLLISGRTLTDAQMAGKYGIRVSRVIQIVEKYYEGKIIYCRRDRVEIKQRIKNSKRSLDL